MVTLDQIRTLEERVNTAVSVISELRDENASLKTKLDSYQGRINELELLVTAFREDQGEIEEGILNALTKLDEITENLKEEIVGTVKDDSPPPGDADLTNDESEEEPSESPEQSQESDPETVIDNPEQPPQDGTDVSENSEEDVHEEAEEETENGQLDIF